MQQAMIIQSRWNYCCSLRRSMRGAAEVRRRAHSRERMHPTRSTPVHPVVSFGSTLVLISSS